MPPSMYIGTAGYVYPHWRKGAFYPLGLPQNKELAHYFENFSTVEINTTWHAFPRRKTLQKWRQTAPKAALLALKAPKLITHEKRLRRVTDDIVAFCKLAVDELHSNLGPLLFQCPPSLPYSPVLLDRFIQDIDCARHACYPFKLSIAVDLRDTSWFCHQVFQRLAQNEIALVDNIVVHDHDQTHINHNHFPNARQHSDAPTASWRYVRFHGSKNPSVLTDFPECVLNAFAKRTVQQRKTVEFTFFLNDWGAFAPKNATRYAQLVANERGVSVKTLFDGFVPLWCKKRPTISSFFAAKNAVRKDDQPGTKKRKTSAPDMPVELDSSKNVPPSHALSRPMQGAISGDEASAAHVSDVHIEVDYNKKDRHSRQSSGVSREETTVTVDDHASNDESQRQNVKRDATVPDVQIKLNNSENDAQVAVLPRPLQSKVSREEEAISIDASDRNEYRYSDSGHQVVNSDAAIQIPEMPSESEESTSEVESHTPKKSPPTTEGTSTSIPQEKGSQPEQSRRQSSSVSKSVKLRLKPSPSRKGRRVKQRRAKGVADIASFFAPASEKG